MAQYYYSMSMFDPAMYHTNQRCPKGAKIADKNRVNTENLPNDRRHCEAC